MEGLGGLTVVWWRAARHVYELSEMKSKEGMRVMRNDVDFEEK